MSLPDDGLRGLFTRGDAQLDPFVVELSATDRLPSRLLSTLPRYSAEAPLKAPGGLVPFLEARAPLDLSLDHTAQAERLFFVHGDTVLTATVTWALPGFLAHLSGIPAIGALPGGPRPVAARCLEILQTVLDLMELNGTSQRSSRARGHRSLQRLRLALALDRRFLVDRGISSGSRLPLSQADLAFFLLTMARLPRQVLPTLGHPADSRDVVAWEHTWAALAGALGIDGVVLPTRPEAADALWERLRAAMEPDPTVATSLVAELVSLLERVVPGTAFDPFGSALMGRLLDPGLRDALSLPAADWVGLVDSRYLMLQRSAHSGLSFALREADVVEEYSKALVEGLTWSLRPLTGEPFRVPGALRANWSSERVLKPLVGDRARARVSEEAPTEELDSRWNDEALDEARTEGDPEADFVIQKLFPPPGATLSEEDRLRQEALNHALHQLVRNPFDDSGLPPELVRMRDDMARLPPWVDQDKLDLACDFFRDHGSKVIVVLFCYGLPVGYGASKGAQVLTATKRLSYKPAMKRRIAETAQMVIDVLVPGALEPGGKGMATCMRVRLLHAMIRQSMLSGREVAWDEAALGVPINQEDLTATGLCFSYIVLDGFHKLGIDYGEDEEDTRQKREAWIHLWAVVAWLEGVDEDLIPRGYDDAERLWATIYRRQVAPSMEVGNPAGRELTQALLEFIDDLLPPLLEDLPAAFMRHLMGAPLSDVLGVPDKGMARAAAWTLTAIWDATDESGVLLDWLGRATDQFSVALVRALVNNANVRGQRNVAFEIPDHFRARWERQGVLERIRHALGSLF